MRRTLALVAPLAAVALIAAGCGSSSNSSGSSSNSSGYGSSMKSSAPAPGGAVNLKKTPLGTMLVGPSGRSLYLFEKDKGTQSMCSGACASAWPPLTTNGTPKAGSGLTASILSTTKRADGTMQVTYGGHPLYYYSGDAAPGQTSGQGLNAFGGLWYALNAQGSTITKA